MEGNKHARQTELKREVSLEREEDDERREEKWEKEKEKEQEKRGGETEQTRICLPPQGDGRKGRV